MKCFNPYFRRMDGFVFALPFPCGRCLACRIEKSKEWTFRIQLESFDWDDIGYITLTIAPEHMNENYELNPHDLTLFFKRLRYFLPYKIRYFACGEYGDQFGRPHYHAIIFGLKKEDFPLVEKAWTKGYVKCEVPRSKGAVGCYVAGYVTKKIGSIREQLVYYGNRYPPFNRCSQGLGRSIIDKLPCFTPVLKVGKYTHRLCRYLRRKLAEKFDCLEKVKIEGLANLDLKMAEIVENFVIPDIMFGSVEANAYDQYIQPVRLFIEAEDRIKNIRNPYT